MASILMWSNDQSYIKQMLQKRLKLVPFIRDKDDCYRVKNIAQEQAIIREETYHVGGDCQQTLFMKRTAHP